VPHQVRIIAGPRNTSWDRFVRDLISERGYGHDRHYVGITTRERAEEVRRGMRQAGRHLQVSVKAFWYACTGCPAGGDDCAYHVSYTCYDADAARAYKARAAR